MPFRGLSVMEQRRLFVEAASLEDANLRGLCRAFGISPTTGYKWLGRYRESGEAGLPDRSRRPLSSPRRSPVALEQAVVAVRRAHPCWGGRKIHHVLRAQGLDPAPHRSTVTGILHRHGLIAPEASAQRRPWQRFERATPNELWQMDFKGHFPLGAGRCHPLTVIDDHSRFLVALSACRDERRASVQPALTESFRRHGLPEAILVDNGPPWGKDSEHRHTRLTAWLMRLGVAVHHGRPYHPQTRGKNERLNGTLAREVVEVEDFADFETLQARFDAWREVYNHLRPHEAIGDRPPASRYLRSPRAFPDQLPPIAYPDDCLVRRVDRYGRISIRHRPYFLSGAFAGHPVGLRPTQRDGLYDVLFCTFTVAQLDLNKPQETDA